MLSHTFTLFAEQSGDVFPIHTTGQLLDRKRVPEHVWKEAF